MKCSVSRKIQQQLHVLWLDNFSKTYAVALQSIAKGAFKSCLWTGFAMKRYIGSSLRARMNNIGTRAMNKDLFAAQIMNQMKAKMDRFGNTKWDYLNNSIVQRYQVTSIPLKPYVDDAKDPQLHQILSESRDGVRNFFPMDILPENIGSNRGLLLILKRLSDENQASVQWKFLAVDCNIFLRVLKVK